MGRNLRRRQFCLGEKRGRFVGPTKRGKGTKILAIVEEEGAEAQMEKFREYATRQIDELLRQREELDVTIAELRELRDTPLGGRDGRG